jgi:prevent-host-death family protein
MSTETLNIHEVKTQLSELLEKVAAGTDVIIAKEGKPIARLSPVESGKLRIRFGVLKGRVMVAHDFDAPLPEDVLSEFEGRV